MNNETSPVIERTVESVNLLVTEKDSNGDFYVPVRMAEFTKLISENAELKCKLAQAQEERWETLCDDKQLRSRIAVLEEMIKEWATK